MSMSGGNGSNSAVSEINVTPLIDVLLVLLIIFMVIVPVTPKGLPALLPQAPTHDVPTSDATIVVSIVGNAGEAPRYLINEDSFPKAEVEAKLQQIFSVRADKVLFVRGDTSLHYNTIAEVIDMGHQAGVDRVGIITPAAERGE
jgi:biopolymer transport protein ExbD/biopolymer transport protein TolR